MIFYPTGWTRSVQCSSYQPHAWRCTEFSFSWWELLRPARPAIRSFGEEEENSAVVSVLLWCVPWIFYYHWLWLDFFEENERRNTFCLITFSVVYVFDVRAESRLDRHHGFPDHSVFCPRHVHANLPERPVGVCGNGVLHSLQACRYETIYRICRNKRPGRLILRSNKKVLEAIGFVYSPLWKITHQKPSVWCTPPFEKSPIKTHRFCVLPPLKNHPSKARRFCVLPPLKNHPSKARRFCVLPPLKITVFDGCWIRGGRLFRQIRYDMSLSYYCLNKLHFSSFRLTFSLLIIQNYVWFNVWFSKNYSQLFLKANDLLFYQFPVDRRKNPWTTQLRGAVAYGSW